MNTTTKFSGIKEFRQHMAEFAKTAREQKQRIVVMNRNKPLFEVKPFADDVYLDSFVASVVEAEADIAGGRMVSHDDLVKQLGLA
jgi:PHD/YefM family antitoxin component YafN of YafNO toxin-antitoxin module